MALPSCMDSQAFWIIVIGSFAGGLVRGITGYGSAIILVTFWVTAKLLSLQPGPLSLTIVSDCISSVAAAVPLFILTKAHKTSDCRLVTTLVIFKTALSPVGAVLLVILNKRVVELTMALCLVAVIAMQTDIKSTVIGCCKKLRRSHHSPELLQPLKIADIPESTDTSIHITVTADQDVCSTCGKSTDYKDDAKQSRLSYESTSSSDSSGSSTSFRDVACQASSRLEQPCDLVASLQIPNNPALLAVVNSVAYMKAPLPPSMPDDIEQQNVGHIEDNETTQLLPADKQQPNSNHGRPNAKSSNFLSFFRNKENQRMLKYGTFAGCMSGLMDGMTGMGGPPIMYMYSKLNVPKEIARGVGASQNLCQFRLIPYIVLGVFEKQYVPLYISAAGVHIVGVALGACVLNKHINQQAFGRILTSLMCACCILLFAAAAGVTSS